MGDLFYKDTVTIWNKFVDGLMETETWLPTVIENSRLLISRGNNVQTSGNSAADSCRLHIDDSMSKPQKPYKPKQEWDGLVQSEKSKYFTLDDEYSFFTKGDTSGVDSSMHQPFLEYMKKNYPDVFKVTSVDRFEIIPHFEVWGK